jgi:anti-anti-sigma factor
MDAHTAVPPGTASRRTMQWSGIPDPLEEHVHDAVVVVLSDELLHEGLEDLRWRLPDLLESGPSRLVVDLSRVSRLSSATTATLLWVSRSCRTRSVEVVLRRPSRVTAGVLHRAGLLARPPRGSWVRA